MVLNPQKSKLLLNKKLFYMKKFVFRHVEREGIPSTKQTLYMLLFIIGFIILAIIIIVPVAVGIATKH